MNEVHYTHTIVHSEKEKWKCRNNVTIAFYTKTRTNFLRVEVWFRYHKVSRGNEQFVCMAAGWTGPSYTLDCRSQEGEWKFPSYMWLPTGRKYIHLDCSMKLSNWHNYTLNTTTHDMPSLHSNDGIHLIQSMPTKSLHLLFQSFQTDVMRCHETQ